VLLAGRGWDPSRPLVALAPGAAYGTAKRWLPAHFARLATMVAAERQAQCVLVGSAGDCETADSVREMADRSRPDGVIDLTGETTLEALAGVLSLAAACVSNDSGAMHLAGAVGVPLVALFGPTREYETAPLSKAGARAEVLINPVWCRPCMLRECPIDHRCMKGLSPDTVFAAVDRLMASAR
jgi:heptosyltransferase-2